MQRESERGNKKKNGSNLNRKKVKEKVSNCGLHQGDRIQDVLFNRLLKVIISITTKVPKCKVNV